MQAFGFLAITLPCYAQTSSAPAMSPGSTGQTTPAGSHVDAQGTSCQELKSRIRDAGSLILTAGPGAGGDLFHARAPQCEFWQRAQQANVRAKDGWCAVGYVCVARLPP